MTALTSSRKVLTINAVRLSIEQLQKPYIHEQFLAYLHIRKRGIEDGSMTHIEPRWSDVEHLLKVDGGPPNKPFYRPFSSRVKKDPSGYWLNPNIPGSYAPSSLRNTSQFMLDPEREFTLPTDHASKAQIAHLKGTPQPAWMFAGYLLRNYSFEPGASTVDDLIDGFCTLFRFNIEDDKDDVSETRPPRRSPDFERLFTVGDEPNIDWFEPLNMASEDNHQGPSEEDSQHD